MQKIIFLILIIVPYLSIGQQVISKSAKKQFEKGKLAFKIGDFDQAIVHFDKALDKQDDYAEALKYKAFSLQNIGQLDQAEVIYHALLDTKPNQKVLIFELAKLYRESENFDLAIEYFSKYITLEKRQKKISQVQRTIDNLKFIQEAVKTPRDFNPIPLPPSINSEHSDYLPALSADGQQMFFSRRINLQEDLFSSVKINGQWQTAMPLENINTPSNEGAFCILPDGSSMIFTACNRRDSYGSCDLYISHFINDQWTKPVNLGPEINSPARDFQPSISADGQKLYFASNRKGGFGMTDIWMSQKDKFGNWQKPENLGNIINTTLADESPFIHPDGRSLYFMSKGHPGMGDFDLFLAEKDLFGTWVSTKNLGYPINSPGNEGALFVQSDGKTAYYSSLRKYFPNPFKQPKKEDYFELDIYQFELDSSLRAKPTRIISGQVIDDITEKPIHVLVTLFDPANAEKKIQLQTDLAGRFTFPIIHGQSFGLLINDDSYLLYSNQFKFTERDSAHIIRLFPLKILDQLDKSKPIILHNIFFDSGSDELLTTSFEELKNLSEFLDSHPKIKIEIHGHTDVIGQIAANQKLSENRAKAVYQHLIKQGIAPSRLHYKGFGESNPLTAETSSSANQINRRVEFIIVQQ